MKATFKCSTLSTITGHCIKTQTFASVFRHQCSSPDIYRFGQCSLRISEKLLFIIISLIFSRLSCIRHPVCDTSFGHIRILMRYLLTNRDTKKKKEKRICERDPELNSCRLTARVIKPAWFNWTSLESSTPMGDDKTTIPSKPRGVLKKVLYGESPPQGPDPYPFINLFWQELR